MEKEIRIKMQSQLHSQLIAIVENPGEWDKLVVKLANEEIQKRGGLETVKAKVQSGEDDSTISVADREHIKVAEQKNSYIKLAVAVIVVVALTLPFHYIIAPSFTVFPKDNLTFTNTFIFPSDINRMVEQYNHRGLTDVVLSKEDPLTKKLIEKGIIK